MNNRFVPVIATKADTGEKIRFPSIKEAAKWLGVHSGQISNAAVIGCKLHGYTWEKKERREADENQ